jgi:Dyp-type peroxidase family
VAEPVLRLANIQGDVIPGFHRSHEMFLFLAVDDAAAARVWLAGQAEGVTSAEDVMGLRRPDRDGRRMGEAKLRSPAVWRNVALGRGGFALLGLDPDRMADEAFRGGMAARSVDLGDPRDAARPGHPSKWSVGGAANPADVLVILASDDADALAAAGAAAEASLAGLRLVHRQDGQLLPGEVEHFGFVDGISQPAPRGRASAAPEDFLVSRTLPPEDPDAGRLAKPGQPLLPAGQFVFGYEWLKDRMPRSGLGRAGPAAGDRADWSFDGSLIVVRQLRQDVFAFRDFLAAEAGRLSAEPGFAGLDAEALGARLVGRWKGGGPLARFPDGEQIPANRFEFNHFGFAEGARPMAAREGEEETEVAGAPADPDGLRCPMSAHIRKVNPRDATTDRGGGPETLLTMVLRRGIPYGAPLPEGAASPEADPEAGRRGLMFVCYQASIVDQFEVLNSRWMNREFVPESGAGHDLIVGQNNRPGEGNERRCPLRSAGAADEAATVRAVADWVVPTGGGYFFVPSISTLRLAGEPGAEGDAADR